MLLVVFGRVRLCRTSGARRLFQAHGREPVEHEGIGIAAAVLVQRALAAVEQGEDTVEAQLYKALKLLRRSLTGILTLGGWLVLGRQIF